MTAKVDAEAPTWKQLHTEMVQAEAREKALLLDEAFDENRILKSKNETFELAFESDRAEGFITKAPIAEMKKVTNA